jgi:hypothetical protein
MLHKQAIPKGQTRLLRDEFVYRSSDPKGYYTNCMFMMKSGRLGFVVIGIAAKALLIIGNEYG